MPVREVAKVLKIRMGAAASIQKHGTKTFEYRSGARLLITLE
jgi:hypothetical protein